MIPQIQPISPPTPAKIMLKISPKGGWVATKRAVAAALKEVRNS